MIELLNLVIIFVSTLVSLVVLGLGAGFSPTLYIAQLAVASKGKKDIPYAVALMTGVILAIVILIILFQIVQLDTLLIFIDTNVRALLVSIVFNVFIGASLIVGGFYYLNHQDPPQPKKEKKDLKKAGGIIGIAGLGFIRTFLSISGVTATYIAGNVIASVSGSIAERMVYTAIFLTATVVPFVGIVILTRTSPARLVAITDAARTLIDKLNYRLIVGALAVIFGSSIVIFNLIMALVY